MNVAQAGIWPDIEIKNNNKSEKLNIPRDFSSDQALGIAQQVRKALFLSVLKMNSVQELTGLFQKRWQERRKKWNNKKEISLYDEMTELLTECTCEWAGIALPSAEIKKRKDELRATQDDDGRLSLRQLRARFLRLRSEQWAQSLIRQVRSGELSPPAHSALYQIAFYREPIFHLPLKAAAAAVELLNILRPLVSASRHMASSALTMHRYPEYCTRLSEEAGQEIFIQQVILEDPVYAGATLTPYMMKEFIKTWLSLSNRLYVPIPNLEYTSGARESEQDFKFNFKLEENRSYEFE